MTDASHSAGSLELWAGDGALHSHLNCNKIFFYLIILFFAKLLLYVAMVAQI